MPIVLSGFSAILNVATDTVGASVLLQQQQQTGHTIHHSSGFLGYGFNFFNWQKNRASARLAHPCYAIQKH